TGQIYAETNIPLAIAQEIAAWLDAASTTITTLYLNDDAGHTGLYQNRWATNEADRAFHDHIFGTPRTLQPQFQPLVDAPEARPPMKFLSDNDPAVEEDIFPALVERFGDTLYITRSHPRLVEGMARGVNKGQ